jgi:hypothetical protein
MKNTSRKYLTIAMVALLGLGAAGLCWLRRKNS